MSEDMREFDLVRILVGEKTFLTVAVSSCFDCPFQRHGGMCMFDDACVLDSDTVLVSKKVEA